MLPVTHKQRGIRGEALRLYRGLLFLYPAEFRDEYARELCLALDDRCREHQSAPGLLLVWVHAALGVFFEAPKEHYHMIIQDLRYAIRVMRRDALVTAAAIVVLALGIGSTTLVFSLADGLLVRPLPYPEQDRLVAVEEYHPLETRAGGAVAFPNYLDIRARTQLLQDLALYSEGRATIRGEGDAERVPSALASDGLFGILQVQPLFGRTFTPEEELKNGPKVVVLGEDLWRRRYGADPDIIGKTLIIGTDPTTVIGVMPSRFHFPENADMWLPLHLSAADPRGGATRTDHWLQGIARLKPGVSDEQASDELRSTMEQINAENPVTSYGNIARALPFRAYVASQYRLAVISLLGAVGFLLLIACANVTSLLLVKASSRAREMAVRAALGASRRRLIRQLVSESVLLGLAGGAAGLALTYTGLRPLLSLIPITLPTWMHFEIGGRVLGFALAVSLLTSILFGLVPAFGTSGVDLTEALKEGGRSATTGTRRRFVRNGLVVGEVALSLALLAGAGLMVRSFLALRSQELGFKPENVVTMQLAVPDTRYPQGPPARALLGRVQEEVSSSPGVASVAFATGAPLNSGWGRSLTVEGYPVLALKDAPMIQHTVVSPGYFKTLGITLLDGREFVDSDWDNPRVTIVDQSLARKYWPAESPIGKRIRFGPPEDNEPWHTIVGVVSNVQNQTLSEPGNLSVYLPVSPAFSPSMSLIARADHDPLRVSGGIRARIQQIDPDIAISLVRTEDQIIERASWPQRFFAVLFAVFAALALVLAAVGLYGVLAYAVSLRTHEIGIRMALGATGSQVRQMVMRQGVMLVGIGLAVGTLATYGLTRLLASQLYQVSATDPRTYAGVTTVLVVTALLASYLPARRATRVDPVVALRDE
jgi:putative ABC transport system permease protein